MNIFLFEIDKSHFVKSLKIPVLQMGASSITPNGSVNNLGVIFDQCIKMY